MNNNNKGSSEQSQSNKSDGLGRSSMQINEKLYLRDDDEYLIDFGKSILLRNYQGVTRSDEELEWEKEYKSKYITAINALKGMPLQMPLNDTIKAAANGDCEAQFFLGLRYYFGIDIERNFYRAYVLFEKSADQGNEYAEEFVIDCKVYKVGTAKEIDISKYFANNDNAKFAINHGMSIREILKEYFSYGLYIEEGGNVRNLFTKSCYAADITMADALLDDYMIWITEHANVKQTVITKELLERFGYDPATISMWLQTNQYGIQSQIIKIKIIVYLETARYLSEKLENLLDNAFDTLTNYEKSSKDKKENLSVIIRKYELLRRFAVELDNEVAQYRFEDYEVYKVLNYYDNKYGVRHNLSLAFNTLKTLYKPYDFRPVIILFDYYRFFNDIDALNKSFIYILEYIKGLVILTGVFKEEELGKYEAHDMFDAFVMSTNIVSICADMVDEMEDDMIEWRDIEMFSKTPIFAQLRHEDIGTDESFSSKEGTLRNLLFATQNGIYALETMLSSIDFLIKQKGKLFENKEALIEVYNHLEKKESKIFHKVYTNYYVHENSKDRKELNALEREQGEKDIEKINKLLRSFRNTSKLLEIDSLEEIFEQKKEIVDDITSLEINEKQKKYLREIVNETVEEIKRIVFDSGYNTKYLREIDKVLERFSISIDNKMRGFREELSTGEYLYNEYIKGKPDNKNIDYSFIAILYYKSLESIVNSTFYIPYYKTIEEKLLIESYESGSRARTLKNGLREDEVDSYYPKGSAKHIASLKFINDEENKKKKGKYYVLNKTGTLGNLGSLLKERRKPKPLMEFLHNTLNASDDEICSFGEAVFKIKNARNKVAHGLKVITYSDAEGAKEELYIREEDIDEYRGLIYKYIQMLKVTSGEGENK